uniref:Uncharacterized protein n=1 Tax=Opuntia streptacantha TaxID=393608 RepID=A0A7C8ZT11_OPUST
MVQVTFWSSQLCQLVMPIITSSFNFGNAMPPVPRNSGPTILTSGNSRNVRDSRDGSNPRGGKSSQFQQYLNTTVFRLDNAIIQSGNLRPRKPYICIYSTYGGGTNPPMTSKCRELSVSLPAYLRCSKFSTK